MSNETKTATLMQAAQHHCGQYYTLKIGKASLTISQEGGNTFQPTAILDKTAYAPDDSTPDITNLNKQKTQQFLAGITTVNTADNYDRVAQNTISATKAINDINAMIERAKGNNR